MSENKPKHSAKLPIRMIRHEMSIALSSIETGFEVLSNSAAKNPEQAKKIHQQGVDQLREVLYRLVS